MEVGYERFSVSLPGMEGVTMWYDEMKPMDRAVEMQRIDYVSGQMGDREYFRALVADALPDVRIVNYKKDGELYGQELLCRTGSRSLEAALKFAVEFEDKIGSDYDISREVECATLDCCQRDWQRKYTKKEREAMCKGAPDLELNKTMRELAYKGVYFPSESGYVYDMVKEGLVLGGKKGETL